MVHALKANPDTAKIVLYIFIAVFVLFMLIGLGTKRKMNTIMDNLKNSELRELIEDTSNEK
jgi:H+/gluconate symporter-like permease